MIQPQQVHRDIVSSTLAAPVFDKAFSSTVHDKLEPNEGLYSRCTEAMDALLAVPRAGDRKEIVGAFRRICLALGATRMWLAVCRGVDAPELTTLYEAGSPRWRSEQAPALRSFLAAVAMHETQTVTALHRHDLGHPLLPDDARSAVFEGLQTALVVRVAGRLAHHPQGVLLIGWPGNQADMAMQPLCHALLNHAALLSLDAHSRLPAAKADARVDVRLSARESECLRWAAAGKTSWETAQILDVRERTVNFHLSNAFAKLNVNNKQAAVARALILGLLGNMEL